MNIHGEKTLPRSKRAKKAFHNSETAPSGARITTGNEAIWKREPRMLDEMKMEKPSNQRLHTWVSHYDSKVKGERWTDGLLYSTRCWSSGSCSFRTWLLRCTVRPSDWTKDAISPTAIPQATEI